MYTPYGYIIQERKALFNKHNIKYVHNTEDAVNNFLEASKNWKKKTIDNFLTKFEDIEIKKVLEQERVAKHLKSIFSDPEWRTTFLKFLWFEDYNMSKTQFKKKIYINLFDIEYYYYDYDFLNDSLFKDYKNFRNYTTKNDLSFPIELVKEKDEYGNLKYPELKIFLKLLY